MDARVQIRSYLLRTDTAASTLGRRTTGDPGVIQNFIYGQRSLRPKTLDKILKFMKENPDGIPRLRIKRADVSPNRMLPTEQMFFRDPCPRCAVRGDIGCEHRKAGAEVFPLSTSPLQLTLEVQHDIPGRKRVERRGFGMRSQLREKRLRRNRVLLGRETRVSYSSETGWAWDNRPIQRQGDS